MGGRIPATPPSPQRPDAVAAECGGPADAEAALAPELGAAAEWHQVVEHWRDAVAAEGGGAEAPGAAEWHQVVEHWRVNKSALGLLHQEPIVVEAVEALQRLQQKKTAIVSGLHAHLAAQHAVARAADAAGAPRPGPARAPAGAPAAAADAAAGAATAAAHAAPARAADADKDPVVCHYAHHRGDACKGLAVGKIMMSSGKSPKFRGLCAPCISWITGEGVAELMGDDHFDTKEPRDMQIVQQRHQFVTQTLASRRS